MSNQTFTTMVARRGFFQVDCVIAVADFLGGNGLAIAQSFMNETPLSALSDASRTVGTRKLSAISMVG